MVKICAFTLAELLITIVIISVVVLLMITMIKPDDTVLKMQYLKAYDVLATASYNLYFHAPSEISDNFYTDRELCTHLRRYINSSSKYNCTGNYVNINGESFTEDNIQFISSNGMIFYLSQAFELDTFGKKQKHRLVWVDLNGKRRPNTAKWSESHPSDIVAFDVTDNAEIVPLGYPKIDTRYLKAKTVFYDDESSSDISSFYEAQYKAFGYKEYESDIFSYNFDQTNHMFNNSALKIKSKDLNKIHVFQSPMCVNNADELFPACSIDIIK